MNESLPTRRQKLVGVDLDGNVVELSHSISKKLYRCPGCRESIPIGSDHVVLKLVPPGEEAYHQHWHRACVSSIIRELRNTTPRPT